MEWGRVQYKNQVEFDQVVPLQRWFAMVGLAAYLLRLLMTLALGYSTTAKLVSALFLVLGMLLTRLAVAALGFQRTRLAGWVPMTGILAIPGEHIAGLGITRP